MSLENEPAGAESPKPLTENEKVSAQIKKIVAGARTDTLEEQVTKIISAILQETGAGERPPLPDLPSDTTLNSFGGQQIAFIISVILEALLDYVAADRHEEAKAAVTKMRYMQNYIRARFTDEKEGPPAGTTLQ